MDVLQRVVVTPGATVADHFCYFFFLFTGRLAFSSIGLQEVSISTILLLVPAMPSSSRNAKRCKPDTTGSTTSDGNVKRKKSSTSSNGAPAAEDDDPADTGMAIDMLASFRKLRRSWPKDMRRLLDPTLPEDRRTELWDLMCEGGDDLRQR